MADLFTSLLAVADFTNLLIHRVNMLGKLPSSPMFTQKNWVCIKAANTLSVNNATARILRSLATNYIFTEVAPDVFANNRPSSVLDSGKSVEELLARLAPSTAVTSDELMIVRPESKHIGTLGITSMIEHMYVPIGYSCPDLDAFPQPRRGLQELCLSAVDSPRSRLWTCK